MTAQLVVDGLGLWRIRGEEGSGDELAVGEGRQHAGRRRMPRGRARYGATGSIVADL